jgi:glucan biosynthesis protein C
MNAQTVNGRSLSAKSVKPQRRWDLDWLRVLATLLLFYFHPAKIFYLWGPWYIQNTQKSRAFSYVSLFIEHWHMPLFFVLAGAASWFALRRRSGGQYVKERLKRLLVPYIFGLLVIVPPQIYFELRHQRQGYAESYLQFYPHFFDPAYTGGTFDMGHLWFILYLFVFSLIALPLFLYLRHESGQRLIGGLAGFFTRPGVIFLLAIPIMVTDYVLLHFYPNPVYFITFFLYGYILMADARFEEAIDRHKGLALILGAAIYVVWISLVTMDVIDPNWLQPIWRSFISWFCLIALLGYGKQFLNFANGRSLSARFLRYFGEAGYPLYILHQTVIVIIGFYVVQWNTSGALGAGAGVLVKLLTIIVASFVTTMVLYDLLVKRTNVTRFLFGMRPLKKRPSA